MLSTCCRFSIVWPLRKHAVYFAQRSCASFGNASRRMSVMTYSMSLTGGSMQPDVDDRAARARFEPLEDAPGQRLLLALRILALGERFLDPRHHGFEVGGLVRLDGAEHDAGVGGELAGGGNGRRRRRRRLAGWPRGAARRAAWAGAGAGGCWAVGLRRGGRSPPRAPSRERKNRISPRGLRCLQRQTASSNRVSPPSGVRLNLLRPEANAPAIPLPHALAPGVALFVRGHRLRSSMLKARTRRRAPSDRARTT